LLHTLFASPKQGQCTRALPKSCQLRSAYEGATYILAIFKRGFGCVRRLTSHKTFRRSQVTHEGSPTIDLAADSLDTDVLHPSDGGVEFPIEIEEGEEEDET